MAKKFLDSTGLTYFINKIVYGITSPKFSTGSTYKVGNFVIYTGKLYRCTTDVTVAGAWSAANWTATTVSAELATINNRVAFPDGVGWYPDVKNGVRGYNTDPARGAGTFSPFKGYEKIASSVSGSSIDVSAYPGHQNFTTDNFIVEKLDRTSLAGCGAIGAGANNINLIMSSTKSYNPSTGVFTFTASITMQAYAYSDPASTNPTAPVKLLCNVYLIR